MKRLACVAAALLGACSFNPNGANVIDFSADASLPGLDATSGDVDAGGDAQVIQLADAGPDATVADAGPPASCDMPLPLAPGVIVNGSTAGQASALSGGNTCGGGTAGEDVYRFSLSERADVVVTTALPGTHFNTAVYVRTDCLDAATQVDCASQAPLGDMLSLSELQPGDYVAVVDGFGSAAGDYQVELTVRPVRGEGEDCDPFGEASRCDDGLMCVAVDANGHGRCEPASSQCSAAATSVTLGAAGANGPPGPTAGTNAYAPQCAPTGSGPEKAYRASVGAGGTRDLVLEVSSTSALRPVAELSSACEVQSSSLACSSAANGAGSSVVAVVDEVTAGDYYAVVDGAGGTSGSYDADFYLRPVLAADAPCDRRVRDNRCGGAAVCVAGSFGFNPQPTCSEGVPVVQEGAQNNSSCSGADGPEDHDFVYQASISGTGDVDTVQLQPAPFTNHIFVSVYGAGGTCPLDLALTLAQGECGQTTMLASSSDEGIGSCPYIDANLPVGMPRPYWLTITRASNSGSGSYTMVVDFSP